MHPLAVLVWVRDRGFVRHPGEAGVAAMVRALAPTCAVDSSNEEYVHPLDEGAILGAYHHP